MKRQNQLICACVALFAAAGANAWTVNERTAAYQSSMEHLQGASQALEIARREVAVAQRYARLPGFQYDALTHDITQIQERLNLYLVPLQRQRDLQTFTPDGIYFNPTLNKSINKETPNEE